MIRCIIVDDEPLARSRLAALLQESSHEVDIVGSFGGAREALPVINDEQPDVLFVDVQMPVLDGFDLVDLIVPPRPPVIFVTAYDEYAIKAFEIHALDYLTKPVRLKRLNRSIDRIVVGPRQPPHEIAHFSELDRNHLTCLTTKVGSHLRVIQLNDVLSIEAEDKLTVARVVERQYVIHFTLDELESKLDPAVFIRTHRSCIVNIERVAELIPWFSGTYRVKLDDGTELPVARRRATAFRKLLGG